VLTGAHNCIAGQRIRTIPAERPRLRASIRRDVRRAGDLGLNPVTWCTLKRCIISEISAHRFPLRLVAKDGRAAGDRPPPALGIAMPIADLGAQLGRARPSVLDEEANHTQVGWDLGRS